MAIFVTHPPHYDIHQNPGPNIENLLPIYHSNIRSLSAEKLNHIETAFSKKYGIITLSETWPKNDFNVNDLVLKNYQLPVIKNRSDNSGYGGLMQVDGTVFN